MAKANKIADAMRVLEELGMPRSQRNERSALCLLALLGLTQRKAWAEAENPLIGITPMMEFARAHYRKRYAPNTRETFRRQTIHQLVAAGIALYNPDDPVRSPSVCPSGVTTLHRRARPRRPVPRRRAQRLTVRERPR